MLHIAGFLHAQDALVALKATGTQPLLGEVVFEPYETRDDDVERCVRVLGAIGAIAASCPNLTSFRITGSLSFDVAGVPGRALRQLRALPLRSLHLHRVRTTDDDVRALLFGGGLAGRLRELRIDTCALVTSLALLPPAVPGQDASPAPPAAPHLRVLRIASCVAVEDGLARAVAALARGGSLREVEAEFLPRLPADEAAELLRAPELAALERVSFNGSWRVVRRGAAAALEAWASLPRPAGSSLRALAGASWSLRQPAPPPLPSAARAAAGAEIEVSFESSPGGGAARQDRLLAALMGVSTRACRLGRVALDAIDLRTEAAAAAVGAAAASLPGLRILSLRASGKLPCAPAAVHALCGQLVGPGVAASLEELHVERVAEARAADVALLVAAKAPRLASVVVTAQRVVEDAAWTRERLADAGAARGCRVQMLQLR